MSREIKTNLVLLIIVIFLTLIAWFKPGLKQPLYHYLSSKKMGDIKTIMIDRKDLGQVKLIRKKNSWFLQEPYQIHANSLRVETILALAKKRSFNRFEVAENELQRFHLKDPLVTVWLNESQFIIGSEDPINQQRYAMNIDEHTRSGSSIVHMINGVVFYQLRANLDSFISPELLPPMATIQRIAWSDKQLDKTKGKNTWHLTPENSRVSVESIAQFIQFWKTAQASKVETIINPKRLLKIHSTIHTQSKTKHNSIHITLNKENSTVEDIHFFLIQEDNQIKLYRDDFHIAYQITPQILKLLTEFIPVKKRQSGQKSALK